MSAPDDGSAEWDEAEWGWPSTALARPASDPGDPGSAQPTERERVGAELVAYRDRDHGPVEWHVDLIDRDRAVTIVSLTPGQAMMVRAQMDVAIRAELKIREEGE